MANYKALIDTHIYTQDPRNATWSIRKQHSKDIGYRYKSLKSDGDEIRLLRIHPASNFYDPLILDISHVSLDSQPEYAALSYTWGAPVFSCVLSIGDSPFNVTKTLDHSLRSFRKIGGQMIWADAICIDQSSIDERNKQVRLMQKIYANASSVFISLGEGEPNAQLAIGLMDKSHATAQKVRQLREASLTFEEPNIDITFAEWGAFNELLLNPWILRTWIVQEATACSNTRIMYAGQVLPFQALLDTLPLAAAVRSDCSDVVGGQHSDFRNVEYAHFKENLRGIEMARTSLRTIINIHKTPQMYTLLKLLRSLRPQQATDSRDKVFGLLGLATDGHRFPQPDYHLSTAQIYLDVAINTVAKPRPRIGLLLAEAGLHKQRLRLPSWVPDWSYSTNAFCFGDSIYLSERGLIFEHDKDEDTDSPSIAQLPINLDNNRELPTLTLHGAIPDAITALGPILGSSLGTFSNFEAWNEESYSLIKEHHVLLTSTGNILPDISTTLGKNYIRDLSIRYANTIIGNIFERKSPTTGLPSPYSTHAFTALLDLAQYEHENITGRNTNRKVNLLYKAYTQVLSSVTVGRRFCVTRNGRMGLVPGCAEVEDVVGVLDGVRDVVILRRREVDGEKGVVLVGDAYVEGFIEEGRLKKRAGDGEEIQRICIF